MTPPPANGVDVAEVVAATAFVVDCAVPFCVGVDQVEEVWVGGAFLHLLKELFSLFCGLVCLVFWLAGLFGLRLFSVVFGGSLWFVFPELKLVIFRWC